LNQDSIYLLSKNKFILLSKNNERINEWHLKNTKNQVLLQSQIDNFSFYVDDNKVYIQKVNPDCNYNQNSCFENNLEVILDLKTNEIENIEFYYPRIFKKQDFTTHLRSVLREAVENLHVYSFIIDSNVYVYDKEVKTFKTISLKAENQYGIFPFSTKFDKKTEGRSQKVYDYFSTVSKYIYFNFDPYREYYYRIYFHGQNLKNKDGLFNNYLDRQMILLVFDKKFKKLAEIELETKKYNFDIIPFEKGIAIPRRNKVNNEYIYDIFEFEKK